MRTVRDVMSGSRYAGELISGLEESGLFLKLHTDFQAFHDLCDNENIRHRVSEPFSLDYFDLVPDRAFWIEGRNSDGDLVHTQAMRMDDLGDVCLAQYWLQQLSRLHGKGEGSPELAPDHSPAAHQIHGMVVYHGEMWLSDKLRGLGVAGRLAQLALTLGYMKWNPDFIYGFVEKGLVSSGFPVREGYFHMQPMGTHWQKAPEDIRADDWIVWMGRKDLEYLVEVQSALSSLQRYSPAETAKEIPNDNTQQLRPSYALR